MKPPDTSSNRLDANDGHDFIDDDFAEAVIAVAKELPDPAPEPAAVEATP